MHGVHVQHRPDSICPKPLWGLLWRNGRMGSKFSEALVIPIDSHSGRSPYLSIVEWSARTIVVLATPIFLLLELVAGSRGSSTQLGSRLLLIAGVCVLWFQGWAFYCAVRPAHALKRFEPNSTFKCIVSGSIYFTAVVYLVGLTWLRWPVTWVIELIGSLWSP